MSTNAILSVFLFLSYLICVSVNSWLFIWTMLEVNTLCFCALVFIFVKSKKKSESEAVMKYLIIQIIASSMLAFAAFSTSESSWKMKSLSFILMMSLLIKMAAAPFYQWFIKVSSNSSWNRNMVLYTWQKLAPVYLLIFLFKKVIFVIILISAIVGAIFMMNLTNLKKIMAFSSVFNLSWMILAVSTSIKMFLLFSLLYWLAIIYAVNLFLTGNLTSMNKIFSKRVSKEMYLLAMINMAGLPPLMVFMVKWMVTLKALESGMKLTLTFLLIMSTVNLFVYLRMINNYIMETPQSMQKGQKSSEVAKKISFILSNILILPLLLTG